MKRILLLCAIALGLGLQCCTNYSEGERTGIITKFSYSGAIWKSWDGDLKIAPNAAINGMIGQYETVYFSIDNDGTIECLTPVEQIQEYARLGIPVTIKYQEVMGLNWFGNRGRNDKFIKWVTPVKRKPDIEVIEKVNIIRQ
jgi:hypothetical protein